MSDRMDRNMYGGTHVAGRNCSLETMLYESITSVVEDGFIRRNAERPDRDSGCQDRRCRMMSSKRRMYGGGKDVQCYPSLMRLFGVLERAVDDAPVSLWYVYMWYYRVLPVRGRRTGSRRLEGGGGGGGRSSQGECCQSNQILQIARSEQVRTQERQKLWTVNVFGQLRLARINKISRSSLFRASRIEIVLYVARVTRLEIRLRCERVGLLSPRRYCTHMIDMQHVSYSDLPYIPRGS